MGREIPTRMKGNVREFSRMAQKEVAVELGRLFLPQRGKEAEGAETERWRTPRRLRMTSALASLSVRSPFQGFPFFCGCHVTQGAALGCDRTRRWRFLQNCKPEACATGG